MAIQNSDMDRNRYDCLAPRMFRMLVLPK